MWNFKELYRLALAEGEGLGTAYEYYVKLEKIRKILPFGAKKALLYGLPEKYGLSLDFLHYCRKNDIKVDVFEKRDQKRNLLKSIAKTDKYIGNPRFIKRPGYYDIVFSSESIHNHDIEPFIARLKSYGNHIFVFAPNAENLSHQKYSGLNGVDISDLDKHMDTTWYLDSPPFPPGKSLKKKTLNPLAITIAHNMARIESRLPHMLLRRNAHIVGGYLQDKVK